MIVTERYAYDAFGTTLAGAGLTEADNAATTWLFANDGQYDAANGLTNHIDRWRRGHVFLTLDAFAGNAQDPLSLHKYLYASGDSINGIDPTGLFTLGSISVANSIASTLASLQGEIGLNVLDSLGAVLAGNSAQQVLLANLAVSGGFLAATPIMAVALKISVGHAAALLSKASGLLFEDLAARALRDAAGEIIIKTKFFRGAVDRGVDFVSIVGQGANARLVFNEVKNVKGSVSSTAFTAFGLGSGGSRIWEENLAQAIVAINKATDIDDATRRAVQQQLFDRRFVVRAIGSAKKQTMFTSDLLLKLRHTIGANVDLEILLLP